MQINTENRSIVRSYHVVSTIPKKQHLSLESCLFFLIILEHINFSEFLEHMELQLTNFFFCITKSINNNNMCKARGPLQNTLQLPLKHTPPPPPDTCAGVCGHSVIIMNIKIIEHDIMIIMIIYVMRASYVIL